MHIHANLINPNAQLDAAYAAEKAAARREAARTRKKLSEFASRLMGECDSGADCVARLESGEESQEHTNRQNQQGHGTRDRQKDARQEKDHRKNEPSAAEHANSSISDWA